MIARYRYLFFFFTLLIFISPNRAMAEYDTMTAGGNLVGTTKICDDVRVVTGSGIAGGTAGFEAAGGLPGVCIEGATATHCGGGTDFNYTYECAGALIAGDRYDIPWPDFDINADEHTQAEVRAHYTQSSVDAVKQRGRAGDDAPVFMYVHNICRMIDKTDTSSGGNAALTLDPLFMGTKTPEEWASIHQAPAGNPGGGPTHFPNQPAVDMVACCAPTHVEICGSLVGTGFAPVGQFVYVYSNFGTATLNCVSHDTWQVTSVTGVCSEEGNRGEGGGGVGGTDNGPVGGYSNGQTGGQISDVSWSGMSAEAQQSLSDAGYGRDPDVDATNEEGAEAAAAAESESEAQAEAEAAEAAADADDGGEGGDGEGGDGSEGGDGGDGD